MIVFANVKTGREAESICSILMGGMQCYIFSCGTLDKLLETYKCSRERNGEREREKGEAEMSMDECTGVKCS